MGTVKRKNRFSNTFGVLGMGIRYARPIKTIHFGKTTEK
jgi:hypothetical protein